MGTSGHLAQSGTLMYDPLSNEPLPLPPPDTPTSSTAPATTRSKLKSRFWLNSPRIPPTTVLDDDEYEVEDCSSRFSSQSDSDTWILAEGNKHDVDAEEADTNGSVVREDPASSSQLYHQLAFVRDDLEQKLRFNSSMQQTFEMSVDARLWSLKDEIKREVSAEIKDVVATEIKTALALKQKIFDLQLATVNATYSNRVEELEARVAALEQSAIDFSIRTPSLPPHQTNPLETPSPFTLNGSHADPPSAQPPKKVIHTIPASSPHSLSEQITSLLLRHTPDLLSTSLTHPEAHHLAAFNLVTSILDLPLFFGPLRTEPSSVEPIQTVVNKLFRESILSQPSETSRWANVFQMFVDQLGPKLVSSSGDALKFVFGCSGGALVLDGPQGVKLLLKKHCQSAINDRDAPFPSPTYPLRLTDAQGRPHPLGTDPLLPFIAHLFLAEPEPLLPESFLADVVSHLAREVGGHQPQWDMQALWDLLSVEGVGRKLNWALEGCGWEAGVQRRMMEWKSCEKRVRGGGKREEWVVMDAGREVVLSEREKGVPEKLCRLRASGWSADLARQLTEEILVVKKVGLEAPGEW